MSLKYYISFISILLAWQLKAANVNEVLHINKGQFETVDTTYFYYLSYNSTDTFVPVNKQIRIQANDSLHLTIHNHDSVLHGFSVKNIPNSTITIPANDSVSISIHFPSEGAFIYHDHLQFPKNTYLGLGGIISVEKGNKAHFLWNIKEHRVDWNDSLENGFNVNWGSYYPNYFTLNGRSNPHINNDTTAKVIGQVGDSIVIVIANTGLSVHSIHFHGYHVNIIQSSKYPGHVGRSKDTFPVYPMEVVRALLVPHQPGEYPVHDHNLVAVTGGNYYPSGMFLTMNIAP